MHSLKPTGPPRPSEGTIRLEVGQSGGGEARWLGASSLRPRASAGVGGASCRSPEWGLAAGRWEPTGESWWWQPVPHAHDSLFFNQHPLHPPASCAILKGAISGITSWLRPGATLAIGGRVPKSHILMKPTSPEQPGKHERRLREPVCLSLDSLTSVSPVHPVMGVVPDSVGGGVLQLQLGDPLRRHERH